MIIKNGIVFTEDGTFEEKELYIEGGRFVASMDEVEDQTVLDVEGNLILPGLVDVHSHGAAGNDFCDGDVEKLKGILAYEKSCGITSYCPTSMTLSKERLKDIFATVKEIQPSEELARIVGINMEGPFVSEKKKGAQNGKYIVHPDAAFFYECNEASGHKIKLVTLAPEQEGSEAFIRQVGKEVGISIGHTDADYDTAKKAFDLGADHVTHLFNAMPSFLHRNPGVIGAAADSAHCMPEIISDGLHVHPSVVRTAFRIFGPERMILISDSMRATGLEDGTYEFGGQMVYVKEKKATLEDGTIAGSTTNLYDCMCRAMTFGIPKADAIFAATRNPAKSIGVYDQVGSIAPGKRADFLIVDQEFHLREVYMLK